MTRIKIRSKKRPVMNIGGKGMVKKKNSKREAARGRPGRCEEDDKEDG
jgi:hypothetical protein